MSMALLICLICGPYFLINKNSSFKIDKKSKIVLFGHSHPECAFNDSVIADFKNLSQSAEPYFYTYQKVKQVLSQNPQIETVLIEYSNNQIDEKMNEWTWGYKYMSNMLPQYFPFIDKPDLMLLAKNNSKDFLNCLSIATKHDLYHVLTFNYNYTSKLGGYLHLQEVQKHEIKPMTTSAEKASSNYSAVNIIYLQKTIAFCKQMHKRVFLVRSPQHKQYEYLKNEKDYLAIKQHKFSDTELLDFNDFPLEDSEYADFGHLNYKGALKFSKWFNLKLLSGLLSYKNKQNIINESLIALK
ncbi:hypothetical protein MuYL_2877 [Mucilaginibacter xinganensis]|uniref:Uncharacterized protein n=2 Tax=Mucilaginibacter xinganensis TaxID=1234841 RepID=A0A223NYJ2_9SPHI|nr:hypothetical protein MuYL_2877 [Mucilaginibacter xinganensis]